MTLFVLSTIPLTNMIKADKRITGHITKHVHPVKIQSYVNDTTIIINQHNEIKYICEIFNKHSHASEAAINMERKKNIPTWWSTCSNKIGAVRIHQKG